MITEAPSTHGGRPLDKALSTAIVEAALRVLAREGYGGFSMAAVAQEAGVHRPAIYRRWATKTDLAVAAIVRLKPAPTDRRSGDVRTDLIAYLVDANGGSDKSQQLASRLSGDVALHDELWEAVRRQLVLPRRRLLADILRRGIAAGQLRADLDVELTVDLLFGVLYSRRHRKSPLRPADIERYVDLAIAGLR